MQKLNRPLEIPGGLDRYTPQMHTWCMASPTPDERQAIWEALNTMQGQRCAYCETALKTDSSQRHIEHFRQRSRYRLGTFDWNNLFGSCNRIETCGDHKDKCGDYNHNDLIKPDIENPDTFLVFDAHGGVSPGARLDVEAQRRAKETIRILNLNGGGLRQIRETAAKGYLQTLESWEQISQSFPESEWRPLVEAELVNELAMTDQLPHATAIRHVLSRVVA
ncbi:retron Ec78 anti-phage system effector HNH endonuclease PtuB [Paucibacter sp. Y2R2-4]|uniref:retron Ec78 anti-phage system effector HNH endonuclease PtuB n=1 Tax=Paucibacter sp. Y2R2-4 TaxID=2893553 RepID=UPI0021E3D643|nr:retron Ec78 anti-phage system effector HNH endonuclease PtuB [Paucibacter sp. Y2R2-4]MCV2350400.1 TIGR02646 family protein [Paucibacter sp. Y2R2-4]